MEWQVHQVQVGFLTFWEAMLPWHLIALTCRAMSAHYPITQFWSFITSKLFRECQGPAGRQQINVYLTNFYTSDLNMIEFPIINNQYWPQFKTTNVKIASAKVVMMLPSRELAHNLIDIEITSTNVLFVILSGKFHVESLDCPSLSDSSALKCLVRL